MLSRAVIRKLIDEIEVEYQKCWQVLSAIKGGALTDPFVMESLDFQVKLASALFRLNEMYRALCQEQSNTIAKKKTLSLGWFRLRMRTLREYQEAIKEAIALGKALGDSYVWVFYHNERELLIKHLEHEEVPHTPPGIGGRGELEFVRNVKALHGHLTIYHGITTLLRIGDVSFIDLKKLRVTAIGEIKTEGAGPSKLRIEMHWIAAPKYRKALLKGPEAKIAKPEETLPPGMQERLKKQIKKMVTSFEPTKPDQQLKFDQTDYTNSLRNLAASLKRSALAYEKADDGLLFIGLRSNRAKSLSAKLLGKSNPDFSKRIRGVEKQAIQLMDMSQAGTQTNLNNLYVGHLDTYTLRGMVPIFWRDIPLEFLYDLFFYQVAVITLYNPAHLLRKLIGLGYDVVQKGRDFNVSKLIDNLNFELPSMEYFLSAIQHALINEDFVVNILANVMKQIEAGKVSPNTKVELQILQSFGRSRS